jgi:hypothetical protein
MESSMPSRAFAWLILATVCTVSGCYRPWYCDGNGCKPAPRPRVLPWRREVETTFQRKVADDPFPTAQEQGIGTVPSE